MSYAPALDAYAFDVAVSFASEDREFVGEIVSQLTASNARVFCDSDFSAGIRGEELPGHLDRIYRRKTPHAVIFVSRFYAEKMWAQNDRLPEQIAMGKPMTPDLTVTFSIQDEMVEAIRAELRRVAELFGRRSRPDGSRAGPPGTGQLRPTPPPPPPPPRVPHIANGNGNGNGNAVQLGQHGIDGLIQDQGWRRIHSAARNSLGGPRCGWSAVRARGLGRTRRRRPGRPGPPHEPPLGPGNWLAPPAGPP